MSQSSYRGSKGSSKTGAKRLESSYQKAILNYLTKEKIWNLNVWGNAQQRKGVPDILVCYKGYLVTFEVKRPGEKPTEIQEYEMEKIRKSGGRTYVVVEVDEVKEILASIDKELGLNG